MPLTGDGSHHCDNVSPEGGGRCLLKECFTTVQKYILSSTFICLSAQARKAACSAGGAQRPIG